MLNAHLIVKTAPVANAENIILWKNYRVTVLGARFFRLEQNDRGIFRDEATQAVLYRDMSPQKFSFTDNGETAVVDTEECRLILSKDRGQVCVELNGKRILVDDRGNLLGTYRTLDNCNGEIYQHWREGSLPEKIRLGTGVCSKSGVAVLDDSRSFTVDKNGEVRAEVAFGFDGYIFAFGKDYRAAVNALYSITGKPPLVPRFALGNWWSRYHSYTDKEYLRVLAAFEEREIPLSVATVDMDWHYSEEVDRQKEITKGGKNHPDFTGACEVNYGWTGYTWNEELFPDYRGFLQKVKGKGLKITLNLHPSDGVRFWEKQYEEMAKAMGIDPATKRYVPFDFTDAKFINEYFTLLHRPYEVDGVDFWWIDWQQKDIPWRGEGGKYDPLWALNHYHYLDNADGRFAPLILSRYAGVGAHRYPIGFSGDTVISWETLAYLPYFTATASNIGYTWWSHDIGGHMNGVKEDELYLRHIQYGVFSPVNRLHCTNTPTMTKEPWAYQRGAGLIAAKFLRFRHKLLPYLYTASYRTHKEGRALVEPLYYAYEDSAAYEYNREYLFGAQLLVCPVVTPAETDGYARVKAWLPEGEWTDIFSGEEYCAPKGGKELTLYRGLESIPVLIQKGGILPLSTDKGNGCKNPRNLEVWSYLGKGQFTLYEDGREEGNAEEFFTRFVTDYTEIEGVCTQSLTITGEGNEKVLPKIRRLAVRFKNADDGEIKLFVDGKEIAVEEWLTDCPAIKIPFAAGKKYRVELRFLKKSRLEKWKEVARKVLLCAEGDNREKYAFYKTLCGVTTEEDFLSAMKKTVLPEIVKAKLLELIQ